MRFERVADELNLPRSVDLADLVYDDPNRTEVTGWLRANGWSATATPAQAEMQRLGRWRDLQLADYDDALSNFVVAERMSVGH